MSDREIFIIGAFATALMVIHLIVNIVQFRKLGRESDRGMRRIRDNER
jgi:hypothetical protein